MHDNKQKYLGYGILVTILVLGAVAVVLYILEKRKHSMVGGCGGTEFGCCPDGKTAKVDAKGTNCGFIGGCRSTRFGCCPDGVTAKADAKGSNC